MTKPGDFLSTLIGKKVRVRLSTGQDFCGTLSGMDGSMNVALEATVEECTAQSALSLPSPCAFDKVLLRGNNVLYIRAA